MPTLRSEGNENNEIGLPLTLLRLGPEHEAAVLEMGMYVAGDIAALAALARPSIGVVTAVAASTSRGPARSRRSRTRKRELVEALPADGTAVLNARRPARARVGRAHARPRVVTYGFDAGADVTRRGRRVARRRRACASRSWPARRAGARVRVEIAALGRHGVHNALAAAAVGLVAGLDADDHRRGPGAPWGRHAPHRATLVEAGGLTILDDTYNASPRRWSPRWTCWPTLPGRRVAVLGEMLELGAGHEAGPPRGRARPRRASWRSSSSSGPAAAGIADGRRRGRAGPGRVHRRAADRDAAARRSCGRSCGRATRSSSRPRAGPRSTRSSTPSRAGARRPRRPRA